MIIRSFRDFLVLLALGFGLAGCSVLMPTRDTPSQDAEGEYPAIGAVPQGEANNISEAEREKLTQELTAAREKNKKALATPMTKQVE